MRLCHLIILLLFSSSYNSQDTAYARTVIKYLSSEKCFGRGYVKNGLEKAEKFIIAELKKQKISPLFGNSYSQPFIHPVNTFPSS